MAFKGNILRVSIVGTTVSPKKTTLIWTSTLKSLVASPKKIVSQTQSFSLPFSEMRAFLLRDLRLGMSGGCDTDVQDGRR